MLDGVISSGEYELSIYYPYEGEGTPKTFTYSFYISTIENKLTQALPKENLQ